MTKHETSPAIEDQRQAENLLVLGIITQGLSHRIANHLNTISLNSELSMEVMRSSANHELLADSLSTITRVAQTGGALVHTVNSFAHSGAGYSEASNTTLGALFADAEDLLNLKSKSLNVVYAYSDEEKALQVHVNGFAVSAVIACLIYIVISNEEPALNVAVERNSAMLEVQLQTGQCHWSTLQGVAPQVLSFARRVLAEQGGNMQLQNSLLSLTLRRSTSE